MVLWFEECDLSMLPIVGGKNSSLGELLKADIPVPPGFAITTHAYKKFLDEGGIKDEIIECLKDVDPEDIEAGERTSARIRKIIESTPISIELEDHIAEYYRQLSVNNSTPAMPVAVRSSATAEDLPGASFAGQQDTFLWIRGVEDLLSHVRKCWSSLFTARAIAYRIKMDFSHEKLAISVGVQKMVKSFTAGVMFTLNPANGDKSSIVVDANWGFGESVVSGECTPDNFIVNKITNDITKREVSEKTCFYTLNHEKHAVEKLEVSKERKNAQCVLDEEVMNLATIGKKIEKHYGKCMDIEWAIEKDILGIGQVMILQSRPETIWSQKKKVPVFEPKANVMEHIVAGLIKGKRL